MTKSTLSAGGVVLNVAGQVCVTNQHGRSWSLPKGHVEPGENLQQAAMREVTEETGLTQLTLVKKLGTYQRYRMARDGINDDKDELKTITIFLFRTTQTDLHPTDPHNPEARWVEPAMVNDYLTSPKDREFFADILPEIS